MARTISGVQPTGIATLGNYLCAFKIWAEDQHLHESLFFIADLHSLTVYKPEMDLASRTMDTVNTLLAVGLDPETCTLFVQSHVPEHAQMGWLMQCSVSMGELNRMVQFKEKSDNQKFIGAGLFAYPALQAADIILYDVERVPVGEDQRQHVEIARDIAVRFNSRYGEGTLVVPQASIPRVGARVKDLQNPTSKMSKSNDNDSGCVSILDDDATIVKKFKRAVTDTENEVRFDVDNKPGVSNLLGILGAVTNQDPAKLADSYSQYGPLKSDTADAVVATLAPIREKFFALQKDSTYTLEVLRKGSERAQSIAAQTLDRAMTASTLLRP